MKHKAIPEEDLNGVTGGTKIPYAIQPSDSLEMIAKKFNCTVDQLCKWNKINKDDPLQVNKTLFIKF
jgi:LysM repeat protein